MYIQEHVEMYDSIRNGHPINDGDVMTNSTLIAIMGRHSTYTGNEITWDDLIASQERLGPTQYEWTDIPEPPVAIPGVTNHV